MEELKRLVEQLQKEWTTFRSENDRRLTEMAQKGHASAETEQKIDKHSAAIGSLQASVNEVLAKMNRPGFGTTGGEQGEKDAAYRKAFAQFMRKNIIAPELEQKLAQIGVPADGGYAVPENLDRTIGQMEIDHSPILSLVDTFSTAAESYEKLYDLRGTTSGWVGETDARPETNSPQFASFTPFYGEIYAFPFATQKMLDDAMFDVEAWLGKGVSEKFGQDISAAIVDGTGVNKPKGILAYTLAATGDDLRAYGQIEKLHSGAAGTFDTDDLIDLMGKLKQGYRNGARWLMNPTTVTTIRKLKDTTGNYIWQPQLVADRPQMLLGYAITEDSNVPAAAAAANAVLFGDFKRAYKFITVRGIRVLRDPYTAKPKVGFYTTQRVGGGVEDTSAIKVLHLAV